MVDLSYCVVETWCLDGRKDRRKKQPLIYKTVPSSLRNQKEIENPVDLKTSRKRLRGLNASESRGELRVTPCDDA